MSCTKRNPAPPCPDDSHEKTNKKGDICCYKGKPVVPSKKQESPKEPRKSSSPKETRKISNCTKRNPAPPCPEGSHEKTNKKGDICCYKGEPVAPSKKQESPKEPRKSSSPKEPRKSSSPKEPRKSSSPKEPRKSSSPKEPRKSSSPKEPRKSSSPKETRKSSSPKETRKSSSPKIPQEIILNLIDSNRYNNRKGYYDDKVECSSDHSKGYGITNFKFKTPRNKFDHLYYHAGDWYDIEKFILLQLRIDSPSYNKITPTILNHRIYDNYDFNSIYNTFDYLFNHMKKGIFVKIIDQNLTFIPFSKAYYKNPNFSRFYLNDHDKHLLHQLKQQLRTGKGRNYNNIQKIHKILNHNLKVFHTNTNQTRPIEQDREKWITNNCNIRNFATGNIEGDINHNVFKSMLNEVCKTRKLPDCEFFLNVRDFPVLHSKLLDPYDELFDDVHSRSYISRKHQNQFCPILSCSKKTEFADMLMVNADDWERASNTHFLDWKHGCYKKHHINDSTPYHKKISQVIFRGSATGCGLHINTNIRLHAALLGYQYPDILDIGLTDWNARPKKPKFHHVDVINPSNFPFKLKNKISDEDKFKYKYILNLDGHVSAFRLGSELNSGSVIFLPNSEYSLWFSHLLQPFVHYIPLNPDLSDLILRYQWCEENIKECENISKNAKKIFNKYLSKDGILDYMSSLIKNVASLRTKELFVTNPPIKNTFAIITIFRDDSSNSRENQRLHFISIMNKLFMGYKFKIYIIEQSKDGDKFNIGKLKNIGFDIASKEFNYDHYIFTDIDMIPDTKLMPYYLNTPDEYSPVALAMDGTRYHSRSEYFKTRFKNPKPFLGGVCNFTAKQFLTVNGFPNNIYGWGGEDDELLYRMNLNYLSVGYPKEGSVLDIEEHNNTQITDVKAKVQTHLKSEEKENFRWEKINNYEELWNINGINNLYYTQELVTKINDFTTQIKVDIHKNHDEKIYPELFPTKPMTAEQVSAYKKKIGSIKWNVIIV